MTRKAMIEFVPLVEDISGPVTKFGGQPHWLEAPQWPVSQELGKPMRFICQIALDETLFPGGAGKVAYIFMTDDDEWVDGTWDPDGGENAVIIQPAGLCPVPTTDIAAGPSLLNSESEEVVMAVNLRPAEDPTYIEQRKVFDLDDAMQDAYFGGLTGNKLGGTPGFIQGDEFPDESGAWTLLLQLDSTDVPFFVNFGDAGVAYAFINEDATSARFLWQCH